MRLLMALAELRTAEELDELLAGMLLASDDREELPRDALLDERAPDELPACVAAATAATASTLP